MKHEENTSRRKHLCKEIHVINALFLLEISEKETNVYRENKYIFKTVELCFQVKVFDIKKGLRIKLKLTGVLAVNISQFQVRWSEIFWFGEPTQGRKSDRSTKSFVRQRSKNTDSAFR